MPKIKFTALRIKNLQPTGKTVEYLEAGREYGTGIFGIRVSPKGKKTFFAMYTGKQGKLKRYPIGSYPDLSLADARKELTKLMGQVHAGDDPQGEKAEYRVAETFSELWAAYIESPKYLNKSIASQIEEQRKYDRLLKDTIGPLKVQDIRKKHLSPVLDSLAKTAPVNANRLFALLSFVLKFALNRGLIEIHPMFGMDRPGGKEKPRKRYLKPEEIKTLWSAWNENLSPDVRDIFRLILLTAQRPGEVMAMESREIDLQERIWTIPHHKTKTDVEHIVPLSDQALAIIEPRMEQGTEFLFPSSSKAGHICNTSKSRNRLTATMDIPQWTAHDLRRTARTMLSKIGVKSEIAERILNHSLGRIEATYDHYSFLDEKRIALNKLAREIARITGHGMRADVVPLRRAQA